jgi:hypothetical protein
MVNYNADKIMTRIGTEVFGFESVAREGNTLNGWHMSYNEPEGRYRDWFADIAFGGEYGKTDERTILVVEINSLDSGALKKFMDISHFTLPYETVVETWRLITLSPQGYSMMDVKLRKAVPDDDDVIDKIVAVARILMEEQLEEKYPQDYLNHLRSLLVESKTPPYAI